MLDVVALEIPDVKIIRTRRFADERGFFSETYNRRAFAEAGIGAVFVQDNHVLSTASNTLRGLHFQVPPHPQAKLVRVVRGAIFDVAVDIRAGSPWFGQHVGVTLTPDGGEQIFVPAGFAHAYATLEPMTEVVYKVDDHFAPECDAGIAADDPDLAIRWPLGYDGAVLSDKDKRLPRLTDFTSPFQYAVPGS